jgi:cobalt-zinc-cadmium efflux system outer membrane protein
MNRRPFRVTTPFVAAVVCLLIAPTAALGQAGGSAGAAPPLTLEQAVALALQHNQGLRAQRLTIDQSRANEVTAGLKPNLVFTSLNQDFPVFTPSQLTWSNVANNQTFTEAVTYVFERGGKRDKRVQVARDTTELAARTVDDAERQLRFQVAQAFVAALLAKSSLELANDSLKDFAEVVTLNERRLASGDIAEGDYLKIALQKLQFEQDVSAAEVALVQSKAALRQLVGYDTVPEDFELAGGLARRTAAAPALDALQREALAARPDLQAARTSTKLANDSVALAHGNRARDFTGELEYDRNGPVNGMGFGFSFEIPIHDRNQGEIARSRVAALQARESESAAVTGVMTDVVNAYAGFRTNDKVVSLYESGYLEQARQSREISTYAYHRGAGSLLDLLDAQRTYRGVQLAYRQALAAYMTSVEQVNFVVGRQVIP